MIPKTIHYIWFGGKDKPDLVKNCIESWKRYLPEYELKEWNEDSFPMNYNKFFIQAYEAKKWAFCSDIARLYALYEEGGIYLDTDVEVFKPLDELLSEPAFTGFEQPGYPVCATMGAEKGNPIIREMLDYYKDKEFQVQEDWTKYTTNTVIMSDILGSHGVDRQRNELQRIQGFTIYPREYFCDKGGYTFHHMAGSWGA